MDTSGFIDLGLIHGENVMRVELYVCKVRKQRGWGVRLRRSGYLSECGTGVYEPHEVNVNK